MRYVKLFLASFVVAALAFSATPPIFPTAPAEGAHFAQVRDVDGDGEAEVIEIDEDLDGDVDRI